MRRIIHDPEVYLPVIHGNSEVRNFVTNFCIIPFMSEGNNLNSFPINCVSLFNYSYLKLIAVLMILP